MEQAKQNIISRRPPLNKLDAFKLLEEFETNNKITARDFCVQHHMTHNSFYYWLKRYRNRHIDSSVSKGFVPLMMKTKSFLSASSPGCLFADNFINSNHSSILHMQNPIAHLSKFFVVGNY
jgi:hypothetical protein